MNRLARIRRASIHGFIAALCGLSLQLPHAYANAETTHAQDTPNEAQDTTPTPAVEIERSPSDQAFITLHGENAYTLKLGERQQIRLRIALPEGAQLLGIRPADNPFVEAMSETRHLQNTEPSLQVAVFRPGSYDFVAEALWLDKDGRQQQTRSETITLHIRSVLGNEANAQLSEAGQILSLRSRNHWLIAFTIGLSTAAAFGVLYLFWRRRRPEHQAVTEAEDTRPAWEIALDEITALRQRAASGSIDTLDYHHEISNILRRWLENRFHLGAPEMTSSEILQELARRRLYLGQWVEDIQTILEDTDLVKFAKFSPPEEGAQRLLDQLEGLVLTVKESDETATTSVPEPILSDEPLIVPVVEAAPQNHAAGNAETTYNPKAMEQAAPPIIRIGKRNNAEEETR